MIVIQNPMDMRRVSFFIVILVMVFSFRIRSSEGRKEAEKLDYYGASPQIDEEMVQKLWISCRLHLEGMPEGLDLWPPEEMSIASNSANSEEYILAKQNLQQAISFLPHEINQALLDCLEKHNIACDVSGEEDNSKNWFAGYLKSVLKWYAVPRRYLAAESPGIGAEVPAPAPAPGAHPPRSEAPMSLFFPPNFDINSPPLPSNQNKQPSGRAQSSSSPHTAPSVPSKKQNNQRSVVVAVSVTVAVTLVVVSLLFCCYQKCRKRDSGGGLKDESPLLHLSLSDYSVGSSGKSSSLANSVKKEKYENLSYSNPNQSIKHSYSDSNFSVESDTLNYSAADARLSEVTSGNDRPSVGIVSGGIGEIGAPFTHLKPPPGRIVPSPSASLLPPPPGRPVRPPLGKTVSPPPGQAVPPPPGKAVPSPPGPPPPPAPRGPPPPPPMASSYKPGPRAPPPPKGTPPRPPPSVNTKVPQSSEYGIQEKEAPKTKLKPFFWDKVLANPDHSMVWDQISTGSFQFNEDMIETLFGYNAAEKGKNERKKESLAQDPSMQYIQIIEAKKAQNLSILLRALNVTTEEVHDALKEGNELPPELLETLLKMAPTAEEELKLRLFSGDISQLGPAERFLKVLVGVPFAFKRLDSLLFMGSLQEEFLSIKESLETLEIACTELRNSRLFLKLLEAVLKTGNRMNDGTFRGQATAFKLDTLLKLADVKGTDGKTTLLHFVVQEIIRSEGSRAIRLSRESQSFSSVKSDDLIEDSSPVSVEQFRNRGLQVVSGLSGELENVKKAAVLDADGLTSTVSKLGNALLKNKEFLNKELKDLDEDSGFRRALVNFLEQAEDKITFLLEEEKRIMTIVKKTADYFHGHAGKDEGLRLFVIVRDFLIMLDKACKEVRESAMKQTRPLVNKESASPRVPLGNDLQERFFPAILERRVDNNSSSDDEDD